MNVMLPVVKFFMATGFDAGQSNLYPTDEWI